MKALLYTSDPYEPSGVVGLFETEEQKEKILLGMREAETKEAKAANWKYTEEDYQRHVAALTEIEIPIGVYGMYF